MTIGELMTARLGGRAEYADRVAVGPVELIVRDVEDGKVVSVGVSLEPEAKQPQIPIFLSPRALVVAMREWLSGRPRQADAADETEPDPPGPNAEATAAEPRTRD
jgi:cell volume regulation protein A